MKVDWIGHIKGGKLDIPGRDQFSEALRGLKDGRVLITVSDSSTRTGAQNRYYWSAVVKLLSDHTGYEPEEMHEVLKLKFNRKHVEVGGEEMEIGGTTTKLDTQEFNSYVEAIQRWAVQELGVVIPDPE